MTPDPAVSRKRGPLAGLRASFLTGLVVVLPVGLTIYLIWTVIGWIDAWVLPLVPHAWKPDTLVRDYFGPETEFSVRGVGVIVFLVFTVLVGWAAKGLIGRSAIRSAERLVDRMPVVRSIYNGLKQIAETVFSQSESNYDSACLVQFPREGTWAIGFVSTRARGEIAERLTAERDIVTIFVPTTPNPTSGFLIYVPFADIIPLEMTLEDAAKLIISAGLVYPNPKDPTRPATG
jgi:uncharacterized membrane protein